MRVFDFHGLLVLISFAWLIRYLDSTRVSAGERRGVRKGDTAVDAALPPLETRGILLGMTQFRELVVEAV